MDFEKVISERYSVRKFKDEHLPKDAVDKILHAGHIAPTGCNYQPVRILVLNTDESISKLKNCTRCHFDAPTAFLICYCDSESWVRPYDGALSAPCDASIVTTHMMLAAQNENIGSCWVMHFNPEKMRETFSIPENVHPAALLVMGYPHEDAAPADRHSSFRPIEEIIFYDSF